MTDDVLIDIHPYGIAIIVIIIAQIQYREIFIFFAPAHQFIVVHFRHHMVPAKRLAVFIDLLPQANCNRFHAILNIDDGYFLKQFVGDFFSIYFYGC